MNSCVSIDVHSRVGEALSNARHGPEERAARGERHSSA
eukprot:CAMPEP_0181504856 /NCGR_PEP_ID=MMETSP1110-20121109/57736_1 /TAXON_ID=174948 /ORGANISM="Symbiodinium sp., Strain CCMP421" /LENGTH=37 /DNA_ID= /DNA_START= /DNA_END= /DNA_ORIENTATION=